MATVPSCFYPRALFILCLLLGSTLSGSVTEGGPCYPSDDKVDSSTHKFNSDCDDRAFCSPTKSQNSSLVATNYSAVSNPLGPSGVCVKRLCRKDEFPFGFVAGEPVPPTCERGFFCPDNGAGCQPIRHVGTTCDMDRDYQCGASKEWYVTASPWNFNGSVCLQSTCMYANVTIGLPCILERTIYSGYNHDNTPYNLSVSRDNCRSSWPHLYCSAETSICEKMKDVGVRCESDRECLSQYCSIAINICSEPPGKPAQVKPWQYALTVLSVLGAVAAICVFLTLGHKRRRMDRYYDLLEYYHEQTSLRASIISLHSAAAQRLSTEKMHDL